MIPDPYQLFVLLQSILSVSALTVATVAAYQVARFYGHRNRQIEEGEGKTAELDVTVRRAVAEATAPLEREVARLRADAFANDPYATPRDEAAPSRIRQQG